MMKPEMILSSDILDILFENRNKEYGAYLLRKEYNRRLLIALTGIPVIVVLLLWMNYMNKAMHANGVSSNPPGDVVVQQVQLENREVCKPREVPKQKPVATIKST